MSSHEKDSAMRPTPGQLREFARKARHEAQDLRRMSSETTIHHWKEKWLRDADQREEYADWYDQRAGRGEITVEYSTIEHREAAE